MGLSNQVPTLKEFMVQRRVIKLYRDFFKATRDIPNKEYRKEVQDWIRLDFKSKKYVKDEYAINMNIHQGERFLRELKTTICLGK